ncbi:phosphatidylserine decarboxylase [Streptomyces boncukensis]|uniref:Phosphatidylserine decarboxylase proenzyme n=1 Tax=Streptomyces boncukensis TaxID=2711219 RepID=A0A6G4WPQ7_9ACTN|nr:phosphatidylserine decarboxylase [Streptomyces boncukensis]NGO67249.1 phosphatidylserine decarboxylase [Streptomyces boncukensis]
MPHIPSSAPSGTLSGSTAGGTPRGVRLARGASPWLWPALATAAVSLVRARRSRRAAAVAVPAAALAAGALWFFRDPEREISRGRVISPADGVVQSIMPWQDGRTRIAIFMSPLNVHVNRAPLAGAVASVEHVPGGFVPAFNKESEHNERVVWHFDTELGDIEMVQIAGTVARRIVPYIEQGAKVEQGERIGLIRFGSRVDVYLPEGIEAAVEVGQATTAGVTRLDRD